MTLLTSLLVVCLIFSIIVTVLISIDGGNSNSRINADEPASRVLKSSHAKKSSTEVQPLERGVRLNASAKIKIKKKHFKPIVNSYQDWENVVSRSEVTWGEFVAMPLQPPRQKLYIKPSVLNSIIQCPSDSSVNSTKVCNIWSDYFVHAWKSRKVKDLCEETANSKIHCYDSLGKSRFCVFENAMMNFRKVRKRKQEGSVTRSWERGFLSADCGEMGKDDIGYLPLYKPDIEGQDEAVCDYVFNETVVAYSHENIRNFGQMVTDYMNVWTMLWLTGVSQQSKDISFFNIDAIKKGKYFGDQPNQFFKNYEVSFRRILRAADFAESNAKVCFKRLILQPRPLLHFQSEGAASASGGVAMDEATAAKCSVSALFQRFNLQIRHNYGLLAAEDAVATLPTNNQIRILLITRSITSSASAAAVAAAAVSDGSDTTQGAAEGVAAAAETATAVTASPHLTSRVFANTQDIVASLEALVASMHAAGSLVPMEIITADLAQLPFEEQVRLMGSASVVLGMHGAGIAGTMHMSVGSKYCCGVIEIFPSTGSRSGGYGYLARRMGHHYARLDLPGEATASEGSTVPTAALAAVVESVLQKVIQRGSCVVPSVISAPYL